MIKILQVTPAKYETVYDDDGNPCSVNVIESVTEEIELTEEQSIAFETERQKMNLEGMTAIVTSQRNALLLESDKLMLIDRWETFTESQQQAIKDYRQALRDITQQDGFPLNVVYPEKPEGLL